MSATIAALLFAFADPQTEAKPAQPPAKEVKKDDPKKDEKPSLFKKKRPPTDKKKDDPDDAGLTPEGPAPKKTEEKPKPKLTDADKDLVKSLGGDLAGDEDDPLQRAAQRMRTVEEQLAALKVEHETLVIQDKIVADLKEIIERAKKKQQQQQQQKQQQQQQKNQQNQRQQSQQQQQSQEDKANESAKGDRGAKKTKEDIAKAKERHDLWGHLPELERQLLNQSYKEDKLPEFRTQLEKYYSKIAEISAEKDK